MKRESLALFTAVGFSTVIIAVAPATAQKDTKPYIGDVLFTD